MRKLPGIPSRRTGLCRRGHGDLAIGVDDEGDQFSERAERHIPALRGDGRTRVLGVPDQPGALVSGRTEVLDNQSVVAMIVARVPRAVIMTKIQNTRAGFDVSSAGLVQLAQAKVPTDVIKAMVTKSTVP
jgi:hypothetical protein